MHGPEAHRPASDPLAPLFESFWIGGFEGADHVNGFGQPLDPNARNGHDARLDEDYAALTARGIRTVRESVGWRNAAVRAALRGEMVRRRRCAPRVRQPPCGCARRAWRGCG